MSDSTAAPAIAMPGGGRSLPAQRFGADGRAVIDYRAITALALPLMVNSSLQAVISLTDTWFVGHISTTAMAGMAAIFWLVFFFVMLLGGVGLAVQTFVAQAEGSRRRWRASHSTWVALWGAVLTLPLFAGLAWLGGLLLDPFGLDPQVQRHALDYWGPRMLGAPIGVMLWAVLGFFNGISRPRITVMTTALVGVVNVVLNQVFIFELDWGIAGAAWATNASMLCGVAFALGVFLRHDLRHTYKTHITWRPDAANLWREFKLGLPMGAMYAADLFGMALFSLMQVRLGQVDGATTQIVVMLTSIAYMPGVGLALAGTTLVGQAIGAGDHDWARRLGNAVIAVTMGYMGAVGVVLAVLRRRPTSCDSASCCCGSPPATNSSTDCSSPRASHCAARATCAYRPSSSSGFPGAWAGLVRRAAAVRLRRGRGLGRTARLRGAARRRAAPALAIRELAEDPALGSLGDATSATPSAPRRRTSAPSSAGPARGRPVA